MSGSYYVDSSNRGNVNELLDEAELYRDQALQYSLDAEGHSNDAATSEANAALSESHAFASETNANSSAIASANSASASEASSTSAANSASDALNSKLAAASSAVDAASSASSASTSASNAAATLANALVKTNNLSDLTSAPTARTNLGLGTAATAASDRMTSAYATASGTANAITLSTNYVPARQTSLVAGHQVRAKVSATNTAATTMALDGLTAKPCVTVTGVALPAGYIRTGVDTIFTYDSTGDRWVVGREVEYGSNANGEFWRYADGFMDCRKMGYGVYDTTTALGNLFATTATLSWTHPASFIAEPLCGGGIRGTTAAWACGTGGLTSSTWRIISVVSDTTRTLDVSATGRWY